VKSEHMDGRGGREGATREVAASVRHLGGMWRPTAAVLVCASAAGLAGAGGCAPRGDAVQRESAADGPVGESRAALTSAEVCVTIRRSGSAGSVFDAQIAANATTTNYGASTTMITGMVGYPATERQTLIQLDLSQIPGGSSTNIVSATMSLPEETAPSGAGTISVYRVTAPWSESTVTWQNFGAAYDTSSVIASFSNSSPTPDFNFASLAAQWVSGAYPNDGLLLNEPTYDTTLRSSETANDDERPEATICYTITCQTGYADCNGTGTDGCETDLTSSAANCGACGNACSIPSGTAACVDSACAIGSCTAPYADCDGNVANGCETVLTDDDNCGGCGVACALANASSSCDTGACLFVSCNAGAYDCDGDPSDGCEVMPCVDGSYCPNAAGCTSGVCASGICQVPTCSDGVQNAPTGDECFVAGCEDNVCVTSNGTFTCTCTGGCGNGGIGGDAGQVISNVACSDAFNTCEFEDGICPTFASYGYLVHGWTCVPNF
jgi:hypothetical protein